MKPLTSCLAASLLCLLASAGQARGDLSQTPGTPDLHDDSDSGLSSSDNITNFDNSAAGKELKFSVPNTVDGATVRIYADGIEIGSGTGNGGTAIITCDGSTDVGDGDVDITATQTESGKDESAKSAVLEVTIDTDGGAGRSVPPYLPPAWDTGVSSSDKVTNRTDQFFG